MNNELSIDQSVLLNSFIFHEKCFLMYKNFIGEQDYIYMYIYIANPILVWLDTRDASSRDRNPADFIHTHIHARMHKFLHMHIHVCKYW